MSRTGSFPWTVWKIFFSFILFPPFYFYPILRNTRPWASSSSWQWHKIFITATSFFFSTLPAQCWSKFPTAANKKKRRTGLSGRQARNCGWWTCCPARITTTHLPVIFFFQCALGRDLLHTLGTILYPQHLLLSFLLDTKMQYNDSRNVKWGKSLVDGWGMHPLHFYSPPFFLTPLHPPNTSGYYYYSFFF